MPRDDGVGATRHRASECGILTAQTCFCSIPAVVCDDAAAIGRCKGRAGRLDGLATGPFSTRRESTHCRAERAG